MASRGDLIAGAAAGETPPVTTPRGPAREAAERELSDPAYHQNDPGLLRRALDAFWEWLGDLFDRAGAAAPGGTAGLAAAAALAVLAAAALWWRLGTPRRTSAGAAALFADGPRSAADHRTAAEAHAAAARWNEAVQERMRAVVRSLEERALLDPRPGRTADEAAAAAAPALPGHADALRAAARTFDDVAYGGRTADAAAYGRLRDLDLALAETRPRLTGGPA
ncbi:hypothetical protein C0216_26975 [Streptomyces globosus]|uniref:Protein-glutamine gamma-glutamyltransferase-like C-terminal domain-containing protein n=1 Tax=Streptomyces globosus TaxID=68209 RepID=A0A344U6S7_9ACTN|nr:MULTISPECIES: DUF4129 domain-containing protein [Streptomyces]AXE26598.1 hypothetical protein C0216_26975 [Streptomyces globosus]